MKNLFVFLFVVVLGSGNVALAEGHGKKNRPEITKAQREEMAVAHEKMAVCLRSEKAIRECRDEMHKAHKDNMAKDGAGMKGMHHEHEREHESKDEKNEEEKK